MLAEIAGIAAREAVDLVLVAGDLFDTAAPSPESEQIVYRALLGLRRHRRPVVVVAGNHDNPRRLAAVAPLLALGRVHAAGRAGPARRRAACVALRARGRRAGRRLALLPFVSQRGIVKADDLMGSAADRAPAAYADRLRRLVAALTAGFDGGDTVNLVAAHPWSSGADRSAAASGAPTPIFEYAVPGSAFPANAHYVALGHLHRPQQVPGAAARSATPAHPSQLDFGEAADRKAVLVVEAAPGAPATVRPVPLEAGRRLRTLTGHAWPSSARCRATPATPGCGSWCDEPARAGLADEVRELVPGAVEVSARPVDGRARASPERRRLGRSPARAVRRVPRRAGRRRRRACWPLFAELLDELSEARTVDAA